MNILFIGPMGSGKTFYSNILLNHGFQKISLAGPIKEMEAGIDDAHGSMELAELAYPHFKYLKGYNAEHLATMIHILRNAKEIEREEPKPRKRLQYIGTEGGREKIAHDIWIRILKAKVEERPDINWVCDDCRFLNEYEGLSKIFTPIKVVIDKETQLERLERDYPGFNAEVLKHASEKDINKMSPTLTIDGTLSLEEAERQLLEIIND